MQQPFFLLNQSAAGGGAALPTADLFWKYESDSDIYTDAGVTPVSVDGDVVGRIGDLSGNGRHANQATAARKPLWRTNQINGLPAIEGVSASQHNMSLPDPQSMTVSEMFMVVKAKADPSTNVNQAWLIRGGSGNQCAYPNTASDIIESWGSSSGRNVGDPTASLSKPLDSWRLYQILSKAGQFTVWIDGVQLFTTGTNTVAWLAAGWTLFGSNAALRYFNGYMAAMYQYSAEKSGAERTSIYDYVESKYGIVLP